MIRETTMATLEAIVQRADALYHDLDFTAARDWKGAAPDRHVVGYLPVLAPIELISAAGMLPLGVLGGGDQLEIIRGDAYFQSYICHLPRSVIELGVSGRLDLCDGFIFPSTCDVIRNLSCIWQVLYPHKWVHYFDAPQDFAPEVGGRWLHRELSTVRDALGRLRGRAIEDDEIRAAIDAHDDNRRLLAQLYQLRSDMPWKAPTSEVYLIQRAGMVMLVHEHNDMLRAYLEAAAASDRPLRDHSRIILSGAFCEQPPLGLLATLERAGCYIVDDDLLLGPRFVHAPDEGVREPAGDPLQALVDDFLRRRREAAFIYAGDEDKGASLAEAVRDRRAEGVIFAAPSFCDPALLERPMLAQALDRRGIAHISFKYAENTGQFQTLREQAGTFADSLKLWSQA